MKKINFTLIGLITSTLLYIIIIVFELDLFERVLKSLESLEKFELDEIIIPLLIFFAFLFMNITKNSKKREVEIEKLKIYKAMIRSIHHILNNFLNQIQLIKLTAEKTPGFDQEVLDIYEETVVEATDQIKALSNITNINEDTIKESVDPK